MKLARIYRECTYSQNIRFVYQGREEFLGNDDVSSLNARKCVAGNYHVKVENARRKVWVLLCHNNRGLKDFFSFYNGELARPGVVAVKS